MPYIDRKSRDKFDELLFDLSEAIDNEGELNYCITMLVRGYVGKHGLRYHNIARVSGVLNNVSDEFYRRVVIPYEDQKIIQNGDVP